ncbi:MAG: ketoacyl-ACP synthase III [Candidatus Omnitrophica bacterium]|nr:ketoacyl-ACP synthase III [Candidatus Omnitrophota bacterium]MDD5574401.1 ketoacyl-ACP synthase III [Candidatus Omnitrophota bacterium]
MRKSRKNIGIIGLGFYVPKKVLTNKDLEGMVDTSDEWITTRTGIKERRIAGPTESTSTLAFNAAKDALKDAKLAPEDLDLIIVATITPDMAFPATACFLQEMLGAKNAACFDMSAACAGFIYGLVTAQKFLQSGTYKNALVIGAEKLSSVTDWQDRNTCVLFGDGAGAAVLAPVENGGILASYLGCDGSMTELLMQPAGGSRMPASRQTVDDRMHFIKMRGNEVFKLAIKIMSDAACRALKACKLGVEDIDCFIPHQANMRILDAVARKMKLPLEKIYFNVAKYGNMSSAATAVALCEAYKCGRIRGGDIVVLDAFGAGLVWGAAVIQWQK